MGVDGKEGVGKAKEGVGEVKEGMGRKAWGGEGEYAPLALGGWTPLCRNTD